METLNGSGGTITVLSKDETIVAPLRGLAQRLGQACVVSDSCPMIGQSVAPIIVDCGHELAPFRAFGARTSDLALSTSAGSRLHIYPRDRLADLLAHVEVYVRTNESKRVDAADRILGSSEPIRALRERIRDLARFRDVPVLIVGETGTGKELVAEAIHRLSLGSSSPLVAINCTAIPATLFESELFGHEAGAFTGATTRKVGLLESAGGGTVFLDEVGDMPLGSQPKLLRALETRAFRRVGSTRETPLAARVVSATNQLLASGTLRPDLRYRLAGFTLHVPPLRQRKEDVPLLAGSFLRSFGRRHGLPEQLFSAEALAQLDAYDWPGNVRELRATVERAAAMAVSSVVDHAHVRMALHAFADAPASQRVVAPNDGGTTLAATERELVERTFREAGGNLSAAARALGLPRNTLRSKLRRHQIA